MGQLYQAGKDEKGRQQDGNAAQLNPLEVITELQKLRADRTEVQGVLGRPAVEAHGTAHTAAAPRLMEEGAEVAKGQTPGKQQH